MSSIEALALLTEEMKSDDPEKVAEKLTEIENDLNKSELLNVIKEFLWQIEVYGIVQLLENVGVELDERYDEEYQKE